MRSRNIGTRLLIGAGLLVSRAGDGQETGGRPLGTAARRVSTPLTAISSVREIEDGRTIVVDARENRLLIADFARDELRDLGRQGDGPGEYRRPVRVHEMRGDSSLVEDRVGGRWLLLHGARLVGTVPLRGSSGNQHVVGADADGRVLEIIPYSFGTPSNGRRPLRIMDYAESLFVVRRPRDGGGPDTLRRIAGRFRGIWETPKEIGGGRVLPFQYGNAMAVEDQAVMFSDGFIAIVFRDPYRVEWIRPTGQVHRRVDLPWQRIPVTEAEKRAAILRRYPRGPAFEPDEMKNWPAVVPPIPLDAVRAGPRGLLLVERVQPSAESRKLLDVIDREGRIVTRIVLGLRQRVVGASTRWLYVVEMTDDDEEHLARYATAGLLPGF